MTVSWWRAKLIKCLNFVGTREPRGFVLFIWWAHAYLWLFMLGHLNRLIWGIRALLLIWHASALTHKSLLFSLLKIMMMAALNCYVSFEYQLCLMRNFRAHFELFSQITAQFETCMWSHWDLFFISQNFSKCPHLIVLLSWEITELVKRSHMRKS